MRRCLLALGSNLRSPQRQLREAIQLLKQLPKTQVLKVAPLYRNPPWGKKSIPDYYNTVALLHTQLTPTLLLKTCQQIETKQGRTRRTRYGARTLDIDILHMDRVRQNHPKLTLPHPKMHEREFVQVPLKYLQS